MEWEAPIWESYAPKPKKRPKKKPAPEKIDDAAPSLSAAAAAAEEVLEAVAVLDAVALPAEDVSPPTTAPVSRGSSTETEAAPERKRARTKPRGGGGGKSGGDDAVPWKKLQRLQEAEAAAQRACRQCGEPCEEGDGTAALCAGGCGARIHLACVPVTEGAAAGAAWSCAPCAARVGQPVYAKADDGFFWKVRPRPSPLPSAAITPQPQPHPRNPAPQARIERRDAHGQLGIAWDEAAGAPRGTTMVTERQAALASAVPRESELRPGLRLVALFPNAFDGEPFACELIGTAAQGRVAVRFDDGLEHESTVRLHPTAPRHSPPSPAPRPPPTRACAQLHALRLLLDQPLFAAAQQRQRGQEGAAAPPSRGASQQRAVVRSLVCQEAFRHGPLHRAMAAFEGAWRGAAVPAEASLEANAAGVPGLHVCRGFLNEEEARRPPRPPARRRRRRPEPHPPPSGVLPASAPRCAPGLGAVQLGRSGREGGARVDAAVRPPPRCAPPRPAVHSSPLVCPPRAGGSISGRRR